MFKIGSASYVAKVNGSAIVVHGEECDGYCDSREKTIRLSPTLPLHRRLWVLGHEVMHGWLFTTGHVHDIPDDICERICDLFATALEQFLPDYTAAGGTEALIRLRPGEVFGRSTGRIGLLRSRYCSCGGLIPPGDIQCRRVVGTADVAEFRMYCEHCDHTLIWRERLSPTGAPTGEAIGEGEIQRGDTTHSDLSREAAEHYA